MRKIFSLLGSFSIGVLTIASFTFAYTQEQRDAYDWAYKYSITTQSTIESANLDGKVTRQAFAKMVINYLENVVGIKQTTANSCSFPDENKITNDLKPYTRKTCAYKIMGSNGKAFKPTDPVDRAQLGTVLSRILWGNEYDSTGKGYYIYHLNELKRNGIMNNINNPTESYAKRGDVLVMLKRIYDKFGSNIYMNSGNTTAYNLTQPTTSYNYSNSSIDISSNDYTSNNNSLFSNASVIYTGENGIKYIYDDNFLNVLKNTAEKKGESDLVKFLEIEADFYKDDLDEIANLDMDKMIESLGIDEDIDPDTLTAKEKQALLKKVKDGLSKTINKSKDRSEKYLKNLEKVTKNISNDKFGLKEKYKKTKGFIDATVSFLDLYSETIFNLLEISLNSEDGEIDDGEGMAVAFTILGSVFAYQGEADEYQSYVEEWAINTLNSLGLKSDNSYRKHDTITNTQGVDTNNGGKTNNYESTGDNVKAVVEEMVKNIPVRGNKNARFTIVEYTELLCPYCKRHSLEGTIDAVINQFSGEVNSISRHFIIHGDEALQLASAMECVAELKPGIYYETFEKAFEEYPIDMDGLISIASKLGVNKASLQTCINQGKYTKTVEDTMNQASLLFGVNGTPGNVIIDRKTGNYELVAGAYPIDEFVKVINALKEA